VIDCSWRGTRARSKAVGPSRADLGTLVTSTPKKRKKEPYMATDWVSPHHRPGPTQAETLNSDGKIGEPSAPRAMFDESCVRKMLQARRFAPHRKPNSIPVAVESLIRVYVHDESNLIQERGVFMLNM